MSVIFAPCNFSLTGINVSYLIRLHPCCQAVLYMQETQTLQCHVLHRVLTWLPKLNVLYNYTSCKNWHGIYMCIHVYTLYTLIEQLLYVIYTSLSNDFRFSPSKLATFWFRILLMPLSGVYGIISMKCPRFMRIFECLLIHVSLPRSS